MGTELIRLRSSISNCETLKTYLETVLVHPLQMTMPGAGGVDKMVMKSLPT